MTTEEIAEKLLWPIWRAIPENFKRRYARNVWQQFEDNIRSAAYTASLARCFETICRRLQVAIRVDDIRAVNAVLNANEDRSIMRALRDETTALVLMVRLRNDERRAANKREREEAENPPEPPVELTGDAPLFEMEDVSADQNL